MIPGRVSVDVSANPRLVTPVPKVSAGLESTVALTTRVPCGFPTGAPDSSDARWPAPAEVPYATRCVAGPAPPVTITAVRIPASARDHANVTGASPAATPWWPE